MAVILFGTQYREAGQLRNNGRLKEGKRTVKGDLVYIFSTETVKVEISKADGRKEKDQ